MIQNHRKIEKINKIIFKTMEKLEGVRKIGTIYLSTKLIPSL